MCDTKQMEEDQTDYVVFILIYDCVQYVLPHPLKHKQKSHTHTHIPRIEYHRKQFTNLGGSVALHTHTHTQTHTHTHKHTHALGLQLWPKAELMGIRILEEMDSSSWPTSPAEMPNNPAIHVSLLNLRLTRASQDTALQWHLTTAQNKGAGYTTSQSLKKTGLLL